MESIRALLDQLMGPDRNGDQKPKEVTSFKDSRVCKPYLLGFCVHDVLATSKYDCGRCSKIHDPQLKEAFEQDPNRDSYGYEATLLSQLQEEVRQCDRRINSAVERFKTDGVDNLMKMEDFKDVKMYAEDIDRLEEEIEQLKKMGNTELAEELEARMEGQIEIKATLQAAHLKEEQEKLPPTIQATNATPAQKTRVCSICGGMLSIFDVDQRLADHFIGKSHVAFLAIRKKLSKLQEMYFSAKPLESHSASHATYREEDRELHREASHSRSHYYDSHRGDRYGSSHRDDHRSIRHHSRSRSYDRNRGKDRNYGRERSRSSRRRSYY